MASRCSWAPWCVGEGVVFALIALLASGCATPQAPVAALRDLPAFHQVDDGLYRGAQPSPEGMRQLAHRGIKTVISLRQPSKTMDRERRLVEQLGMRWVSLPMWFWWRPSDRQVRQFLAIAADPASRPVFVHCRQGWNRVGILVAVYRVVHNGWTPEQAYREARQHGLVPWNLVSRYLIFYETPREFAGSTTQP